MFVEKRASRETAAPFFHFVALRIADRATALRPGVGARHRARRESRRRQSSQSE